MKNGRILSQTENTLLQFNVPVDSDNAMLIIGMTIISAQRTR